MLLKKTNSSSNIEEKQRESSALPEHMFLLIILHVYVRFSLKT